MRISQVQTKEKVTHRNLPQEQALHVGENETPKKHLITTKGEHYTEEVISKQEFIKKIHQNEESYFGSITSKYLARRYRKYLKLSLLDAGAGDGSLLQVLRKKNPDDHKKIFGIDLTGDEEKGITTGSITDLPWKDESMNSIVCSEVLEHLDESDSFKSLREFHRTLTKGGFLICTLPFQENLNKQTMLCPHCDKQYHRYGHMRSFQSKEEVFSLLNGVGLKVVRMDVYPLGAVSAFPLLRVVAPLLNKLNNPPGLRKRAITVLQKTTQ